MPDTVTAGKSETTSTTPINICESHSGMWVKIARTSLNLTTQQLADRAGVSPADVDALENDTLQSPDVKQKLLHVLWTARSNGQTV